VIELALRCNYAADHAQQVARLALAIFDGTRETHGLDDRAREWLDFAAILHDVGVHISYERHHRHSYYLVKNGDLRGFEPDEIEVMALVTRYHRRGAPRKGHETFAARPRAGRRVVRWLSAMLRVAESLDRSRAQLVDAVRLRRKGRQWTLRVDGRGDIELELWAAQRNIGPLEEALGGAVTVTAARTAG
jgi:exopolyphosphatase/guanosine-5'-triphosphate,3'-diphosphate pyrophosphatase